MKGKSKTQKGITLVALIITVVVLLILAAVTISSIQNDGIIGKAEGSADKFNGAQGNEQGILGSYEDELNKYGGSSGEQLTEEDLTEIELVERYVLGAEKTGRSGLEVANVDMSSLQVTSYKDDPDSITDASTTVTPLFTAYTENNLKSIACLRYNNKVYNVKLDSTTFITESVELIYKPEGREGTTVAYDSDNDGTTEEWVIITDRNGTVEIVSKNVMGSLTLGGTDTEIKANLLTYLDLDNDGIPDDLDGDGVIEEGGTDLDGDGTTEVDYQDIAIASYNNAITTINKYCKSLVTATNNSGVRSVGGTNNSYTAYSSTNYDNWGSGITVDVASGDLQFEEDMAKMYYYGIANVSTYYWVASRFVREYSSDVGFYVRGVYSDGIFGGYFLWGVYSDGNVYSGYPSYAVRPVVINPSGI